MVGELILWRPALLILPVTRQTKGDGRRSEPGGSVHAGAIPPGEVISVLTRP
jgi:hypothetical protein